MARHGPVDAHDTQRIPLRAPSQEAEKLNNIQKETLYVSYLKIRLTFFSLFVSDLLSNTISTSEEWSSLGKEANGGENNNEATNNLHLLASAGLDDLTKEDSGGGLEDADSNTSTPRKRKRSSDDNIRMQTDVVRVPGISQELQQQITKFDSSEFDVSKSPLFLIRTI